VWLGKLGPFTQNGWNCATKEALGAGIGPNPFSPDGIYWEPVPELDRTIDMESTGGPGHTPGERPGFDFPNAATTFGRSSEGQTDFRHRKKRHGQASSSSMGSVTGGSTSGGISSSDSGVQAIVGAVRDVSKELGTLRRQVARTDGGLDFRTGRLA